MTKMGCKTGDTDDGNRGLVGTVPIYLSEISSPQHRGLIGGISGCGIAFGTMVYISFPDLPSIFLAMSPY